MRVLFEQGTLTKTSVPLAILFIFGQGCASGSGPELAEYPTATMGAGQGLLPGASLSQPQSAGSFPFVSADELVTTPVYGEEEEEEGVSAPRPPVKACIARQVGS